LIDIKPKLIEINGGTNLTLSGFGFVNSEPGQIKAKYTSATKGDLKCGTTSPCVLPANFVTKNTIWT
jgi:hypothetical protein